MAAGFQGFLQSPPLVFDNLLPDKDGNIEVKG